MSGIGTDLYPEETVYSWSARYADRLSFTNRRHPMQTLFGHSVHCVAVDCPGHLEALVASLPAGHVYTVSQLIEGHTLLPFYRPFLPRHRVVRLQREMGRAKGPGRFLRGGVAKVRVPFQRCLRFCPICVETDRRTYGEPYWHRSHQLPPALVCPKHEVFLESSAIPYSSSTGNGIVSAAKGIRPCRYKTCSSANHLDVQLLRLATDAQWLMRHSLQVGDAVALNGRYRDLLIRAGFGSLTGVIHQRRLAEALRKQYGRALLHRVESPIVDAGSMNWLRQILDPSLRDVVRPAVHHLLLMGFLAPNAQAFYESSTKAIPFGAGPWPCLNPVASHYREPVITRCSITATRYDSTPKGTFRCRCGFAYLRRGPDRRKGDRYRVGRVVQLGREWIQRLHDVLAQPWQTWKTVCKTLGFGVVRIGHAIMQEQLSHRLRWIPRRICRLLRANRQLVTAEKLKGDKAKLLETLARMPGITRTRLKIRHPSEYARVFRKDPRWCAQHFPPPAKTRCGGCRPKYSSRDDRRLAQQVRRVAHRLRRQAAPLVRVTRHRIYALLQRVPFTKKQLARLPQLSAALAEVCEAPHVFVLRRLRTVLNKIRENGLELTKTRIMRLSGLENTQVVKHPLVAKAIAMALHE